MNDSIGQRFKSQYAQPAWRLKLFVFFLIGLVTFLLALIVKKPLACEILMSFSVTFMAVAFIDFLWDLMGGDLLENRIDSMQRSLKLLADLTEGCLGVERAWAKRKLWESDDSADYKQWQEWVLKAKQVEVINSTFWYNWLKDDSFSQKFLERIESGAQTRILLNDPASKEITWNRAEDEGESLPEMINEIFNSLTRLGRVACKNMHLPHLNMHLPYLRLTNQFPHYIRLIRADDRMLVTFVLSGKSGSQSPTIQLLNPSSEYFKIFLEQFEIVWKRGMKLTPQDLDDLINRATMIEKEYLDSHT